MLLVSGIFFVLRKIMGSDLLTLIVGRLSWPSMGFTTYD